MRFNDLRLDNSDRIEVGAHIMQISSQQAAECRQTGESLKQAATQILLDIHSELRP